VSDTCTASDSVTEAATGNFDPTMPNYISCAGVSRICDAFTGSGSCYDVNLIYYSGDFGSQLTFDLLFESSYQFVILNAMPDAVTVTFD